MGPPVKLRVRVAAGIELLRTVPSHIDEINRDLFGIRPDAGGIRKDQHSIVAPEKLREFFAEEALVAHLESIAEGGAMFGLGPAPVLQSLVMTRCERRRLSRVAREKLEKLSKTLCVVLEIVRKLPEDRAELFGQAQDPRSEEIGEWLLHVAQLFHMRDEAAAFDGEDEISRGLFKPASIAGRSLERIERAVNLYRIAQQKSVRSIAIQCNKERQFCSGLIGSMTQRYSVLDRGSENKAMQQTDVRRT